MAPLRGTLDDGASIEVVRAPFRRRGVADRLLAGAVDFARDEGAAVVGGHPVDASAGRVSSAFASVGSTTLVERAGFERAAETTSRSGGAPRCVLRRELAGIRMVEQPEHPGPSLWRLEGLGLPTDLVPTFLDRDEAQATCMAIDDAIRLGARNGSSHFLRDHLPE